MSAKSIPRNVLLPGLTSFFTDVSSEMVYPLLRAQRESTVPPSGA